MGGERSTVSYEEGLALLRAGKARFPQDRPRRKYGNQRTTTRTSRQTTDSKLEAAVRETLDHLEKTGDVRAIVPQEPKIVLCRKSLRWDFGIEHWVDFTCEVKISNDGGLWRRIYIEAKGYATAEWRAKARWMLQLHPEMEPNYFIVHAPQQVIDLVRGLQSAGVWR